MFWFIVPKVIEHDNTKPMCLELECEPKNDGVKVMIYEKINGKVTITKNGCLCQVAQDYKRGKKKEEWCPACHMYLEGLHDSSLVIADKEVSHSYFNPILDSRFDVQRLYLGSDKTEFARRFSRNRRYREISALDVERAFECIEQMGACVRRSDQDAKDEALRVLEFLKRFNDDDSVRMIIADDY